MYENFGGGELKPGEIVFGVVAVRFFWNTVFLIYMKTLAEANLNRGKSYLRWSLSVFLGSLGPPFPLPRVRRHRASI